MPVEQPQPAIDSSIAAQWWEKLTELTAESGIVLPPFEDLVEQNVWALAKLHQVPRELQAKASAAVLDVPYWQRLDQVTVLPGFVQEFPISFARQHQIAAVRTVDGERYLALTHLQSWDLLDVVRRLLGDDIQPIITTDAEILRLINAAYQQRSGQVQNLLESLDPESIDPSGRVTSAEDLLDLADRPTVIKLVNLILFEAVQAGASDIHIQPAEQQTTVRLRIDGVLFNSVEVPKDMQEEVISRIKILGKMNIAEKRLPQDGRATVQVGDRLIDLRIASLPSEHGERVVIRLLDKSARLYTLPELGMDPITLERFREVIHLEHGLVLVTGPTGSGKSTTLYGALQEINTLDRNVVTLEDPIEYQIDGISQTQINMQKGLTFATGLRNVLRQDPDIIMVGEIRDQETAAMAIQSALTGHLVFSTLHTNDAASAVARMLDLGVEPYLLSSSLLAVMAQRLIRKVCHNCQTSRAPSAEEMKLMQEASDIVTPEMLVVGTGCDECRQSGYRGRLGIFELLMVNDDVRSKIQNQANASEIRESAMEVGMRLLRKDGLLKIAEGKTTPAEVKRVTMRTAM